MKKTIIGAAALLLSSSALAGTMMNDEAGSKDPATLAKWESVDKSWKGAATGTAGDIALAEKSALPLNEAEVHATGTSDLSAKQSFGETQPTAEPAAAATWDEATKAQTQMATDTGVGGPIETAESDPTPRPASQNYPPCDPGPGDDNCIQLYEPGVRTALASWNRSLGGLEDGSATTAMGGPYEPVIEEHATETASMGASETMPDAAYAANELDSVAAESASHQGVGGPLMETGYPPCSGSPSDDRCIQLYEPGVTGEGN